MMANGDIAKLRIDKKGFDYHRRRRRPVVFLTILLIFMIASVVFFLALYPALEVEVTTVSVVYPSQGFTLLNASGYVVAQRKAAVASKATGRLEWLGVEEGSRVKQGEVIARLEDRDVVAALEQARANLNGARSALDETRAELQEADLEYQRMKELLQNGFVSQREYDNAEIRYQRAQAAVEVAMSSVRASQAAVNAAEVEIEYTRIRAPFDAVVLTKNADIGDIITPLGAAANAKAAVVSIADMSSLQVEADVSESNLEKVRVGQPCEIQLDALPESRFHGVVHMIVPTADRTKASVMVKVRFLDYDSRILPEMSARVAFLERQVTREEQKPLIGVKRSAVVERNSEQTVFLVQGNRVVEVPIRIGLQMGDMVEVIEGLKPGNRVVINPARKLKNGSRIAVIE